MADKTLSSVIGSGGGSFVPSSISGKQVISSGASGVLFALTPPIGEKVRLTGLSAGAAGTDVEANVELRVNGVSLGPTDLSGGATSPGYYFIGERSIQSTGDDAAFGIGNSYYIVFGVNDVITVVKTTGSTALDISYSFEYGG